MDKEEKCFSSIWMVLNFYLCIGAFSNTGFVQDVSKLERNVENHIGRDHSALP